MKDFESISERQKGRKRSSVLHRIAYRLHYAMYSLLLLGLLLLAFAEGLRLLGAGLVVLALIGFVVFGKLQDRTAPKDDFDADENGNAKPNYR